MMTIIPTSKYEAIIREVQNAQAFDRPCILLFVESCVDDDGDTVDRLKWQSSCNSSYEMLGMTDRAAELMNAKPVIIQE